MSYILPFFLNAEFQEKCSTLDNPSLKCLVEKRAHIVVKPIWKNNIKVMLNKNTRLINNYMYIFIVAYMLHPKTGNSFNERNTWPKTAPNIIVTKSLGPYAKRIKLNLINFTFFFFSFEFNLNIIKKKPNALLWYPRIFQNSFKSNLDYCHYKTTNIHQVSIFFDVWLILVDRNVFWTSKPKKIL